MDKRRQSERISGNNDYNDTNYIFYTGKNRKSSGSQKNVNIKYIRVINTNTNPDILPSTDNIRFKLLGFLGEKAIVSTLGNEKIYILNQSAIDAVELQSAEKN